MGSVSKRFASRTLALCAALAVACVPSASADTLTASLACPKQGPHRACLTVPIMPMPDGQRCGGGFGKTPLQTSFVVKGRLDGGDLRQHRLKVDDFGYAPPALAYLGQSPAGRAIVLTDRGPLEIFDKAFNHELSVETYIVDKRRWKIKARIIAAMEAGPYVTTANDIGIWDEERQLCISAPIEPGRRLRLIEGGCAARPKEPTDLDRARETQMRTQQEIRNTVRVFAEWYAGKSSTGYVEPPSGDWVDTPRPNEFAWIGNVEREYVTLNQLKRLLPDTVNDEMGPGEERASHFGGAGTGIRVLRIKGSQTLIVSVTYDGGGCD